jgi:hypothetical protein
MSEHGVSVIADDTGARTRGLAKGGQAELKASTSNAYLSYLQINSECDWTVRVANE